MTARNEVTIARAIEACIRAAVEGRDVRVDRDRDSALCAEEIPAVQLFGAGLEVIESYVGGLELVAVRIRVESLADRGELESDPLKRPALSGDDAAGQLRLCREALLADRTLGGACIGLDIAPAEAEAAAAEGKSTSVRVEAMLVSAHFIRR
jgi:hypothetical protein